MERAADTVSYIKKLPLARKLLVTKIINVCMQDGKKSRARALCFNAFPDVFRILQAAVENVKPICGFGWPAPPTTFPLHRQQSLSMRWVIEAARKRCKARQAMGMPKALADELLDASKWKKRDDMHRLAEANRTLAHYRWW